MLLQKSILLRDACHDGSKESAGVNMQGRTQWELRIFCAVTERQSFVAAARALGISPSAATRSIQALEEQLGTALLQRSQKRVSLTAAGEVYYDFAQRILEQQTRAEESIADLQNAAKGWIRFSAPEICSRRFFPQQLSRLAHEFPDVQFDVQYTDALLDPVQEQLDFAIRGAFPVDSELIGYPLWEYDRILCAAPDYIRRYGLAEEPEQLHAHQLILHTAPRILKDWYFASASQTIRMHMRPSHRVNTGTGLLEMTMAGMGVGRLASWVARSYLESGELVRVCPAYRIVSATGQAAQMHAVYSARSLSKRTRLLLEKLRAAAREAKM
jgi:DNA-binding transcriptional LysR family regulator